MFANFARRTPVEIRTPKQLLVDLLTGKNVSKKLFMTYVFKYDIYDRITEQLEKHLGKIELRNWFIQFKLDVIGNDDFIAIDSTIISSILKELMPLKIEPLELEIDNTEHNAELKRATDECSICLLPGIDCKLGCHGSHVFHRECVSEWLEEHSTCPNCRQQLHDIESWYDQNFVEPVDTSFFNTIFGMFRRKEPVMIAG